MELNYNIVYDYLTNDNTKVKKLEFLSSIGFLENYNYTMNDLKFIMEKFITKTTFYYRIEKEAKNYHDLIRKILFNNNEEQPIRDFAKNKFLILFLNRILIPEDYKYFKESFLEYIYYGIKNKLDRFKYFEEFVNYHYKNNDLKENNKLLSKILVLRDCTYPIEYLQILNNKKLDYTLEAFMLTSKELIMKDESMGFLKYENTFFIIEEIMDNLQFFEVNKLSLTKCIKYHGFSIFSLLLLFNCIKKYKITISDYKIIFNLLDEFKLKNRYHDYHDKYLNTYFEYCMDKKLIKPEPELLNLCGKYNVKKLFDKLIDVYKIKPTENTLTEILNNIKSNDCENLSKMIDMKFIINKEEINKLLKKGKFNSKLREVLVKNSFVELNDEIFEEYIKYENYLVKDTNKINTDLVINEITVLGEFNLDKTVDYFDIIHKYNKELNYKMYMDFLLEKCGMKKKELKHIVEFTRFKYKYYKDKENSYKINVDNYLEKSKLKINKYCLDMCMKAGNYESGIYLIEKFNLKPDLTTLLFVKDIDKRIQFYKLYY
jgi:hypothetical protein